MKRRCEIGLLVGLINKLSNPQVKFSGYSYERQQLDETHGHVDLSRTVSYSHSVVN